MDVHGLTFLLEVTRCETRAGTPLPFVLSNALLIYI
jgi:hypothetical protein